MMSEESGKYKGLSQTPRRNFRKGKNGDGRRRIVLDHRQRYSEYERNNHNLSSLVNEELRKAAEDIQNAALETKIASEELCRLAESARKYAEMLRATNNELREATKMLRQAASELAQSPKRE